MTRRHGCIFEKIKFKEDFYYDYQPQSDGDERAQESETNTTAQQKSLEKLSSGYRINRAGDDAAGLSISEKMRGQIRGLDQASRNSQDGISMIQTAEGSLNEVHSILQRMRELAVQASNDTYVTKDRAAMQAETDQLVAEIGRISTNTEFNGKKLLDSSAGTVMIQVGANSGQGMSLDFTTSGIDLTATVTGVTANLSTNALANTAITNIDAELQVVSDGRSLLGAYQIDWNTPSTTWIMLLKTSRLPNPESEMLIWRRK